MPVVTEGGIRRRSSRAATSRHQRTTRRINTQSPAPLTSTRLPSLSPSRSVSHSPTPSISTSLQALSPPRSGSQSPTPSTSDSLSQPTSSTSRSVSPLPKQENGASPKSKKRPAEDALEEDSPSQSSKRARMEEPRLNPTSSQLNDATSSHTVEMPTSTTTAKKRSAEEAPTDAPMSKRARKTGTGSKKISSPLVRYLADPVCYSSNIPVKVNPTIPTIFPPLKREDDTQRDDQEFHIFDDMYYLDNEYTTNTRMWRWVQSIHQASHDRARELANIPTSQLADHDREYRIWEYQRTYRIPDDILIDYRHVDAMLGLCPLPTEDQQHTIPRSTRSSRPSEFYELDSSGRPQKIIK
ncbi:hypothetical protein HDV63DRAFT_71555 [Trichoderma sp. SZMC 28014]